MCSTGARRRHPPRGTQLHATGNGRHTPGAGSLHWAHPPCTHRETQHWVPGAGNPTGCRIRGVTLTSSFGKVPLDGTRAGLLVVLIWLIGVSRHTFSFEPFRHIPHLVVLVAPEIRLVIAQCVIVVSFKDPSLLPFIALKLYHKAMLVDYLDPALPFKGDLPFEDLSI